MESHNSIWLERGPPRSWKESRIRGKYDCYERQRSHVSVGNFDDRDENLSGRRNAQAKQTNDCEELYLAYEASSET